MESQGSFGQKKGRVFRLRRESDKNQEKRSGTISRRSFLKAAVVGGLVVGGALAARKGLKLAEQVATELGPSYNPSEVYAGTVEISRGVNVRKSPTIPSSGAGNTVDWGSIEEVNGVSLNGADAFEVDNPQIFRGFDPNAGRGTQDSPWIKLKARIKNLLTGDMDHYIFISMDGLTADFVKTPEEAPFIPLSEDRNGQLTAQGHGINFSANQIGIVRVNPPK